MDNDGYGKEGLGGPEDWRHRTRHRGRKPLPTVDTGSYPQKRSIRILRHYDTFTIVLPNTILIVDDDVQIRGLCRMALEEPGYDVSEASNGREALAALHEQSFGLIVLDLSMPDMDGFEFLSAVRAKSPKLHILVISGFLGGTMLKAAKLFGAAATLAKPFSPESLLSVVYEVLGDAGPMKPPN